MIWFACKCGKVHGRPEHSVGAMVFCACGQGLTVPWESTAPAPPSVPAAEPRPGLKEPLRFEATPPRATEPRATEPGPRRSAEPAARRRRREPDPNFCFNHETVAKRHVCVECELSFCDDCVADFRGKTLCGPCKNYLVKMLQKAPRASGWAMASLFTALVTAPALFCLMPLGRPWLVLLGLTPHALAIAAGVFALRRVDAAKNLGGRPQAITGIVVASLAAAVTIAATVTLQRWGP